MLDRRLRLWPNIEPTFLGCILFTGLELCVCGEGGGGGVIKYQLIITSHLPSVPLIIIYYHTLSSYTAHTRVLAHHQLTITSVPTLPENVTPANNQCWGKVGPSSTTLAHRRPTLVQYLWVVCVWQALYWYILPSHFNLIPNQVF